MALMHACVIINATLIHIRPLLFIRENVFERVRPLDPEYSQLETAVASLDWTEESLLELVERRLSLPFNTKLPLRGPTWDYFFPSESEYDTKNEVFSYCQSRPRDILTFCAQTVESAQAHKRERVSRDDILLTKRKFSENRLKDLCDEYSENFPRVDLVVSQFYGLGAEFTVNAASEFIRHILDDDMVKQCCKTWLFDNLSPERFMHLLFSLGFAGIRNGATTVYRSVGVLSTSPPSIQPTSVLVIHPVYRDALGLQNVLLSSLGGRTLRKEGLVEELPEGVPTSEYLRSLDALSNKIGSMSTGHQDAATFEEAVGDVIKLCFFKS